MQLEVHFDAKILDKRDGFIRIRLSGKGASNLAKTEPGGHRYQRVPPTEKKGRVHTSTVTVAVLDEESTVEINLDMKDVRIDFYRSSGSGGQHRNKTDSACRVTHIPSGIVARAENERQQCQNKANALAALKERLLERASEEASGDRKTKRKKQVGTGQRADKVRTTRLQDNMVTDHISGKKHSAKKYLKGDLSWLV